MRGEEVGGYTTGKQSEGVRKFGVHYWQIVRKWVRKWWGTLLANSQEGGKEVGGCGNEGVNYWQTVRRGMGKWGGTLLANGQKGGEEVGFRV
jgi:hypothetical protein